MNDLRIKILFIVFLCCSIPAASRAQSKQVLIRIIQDESVPLDGYETRITLKRQSFKIQVLFENATGLFSFASFSETACCNFSEQGPIPGFSNLKERVIPEPDFNKEKELMLHNGNNCSYWYYEHGLTWKGFNKKIFPLDSNRVVAVKSVKQLFDYQKKEQVKIKDVRNPLYLFFVAVSEFDSNGKPKKELVRKKLTIDWIEED